jgi:hypothetical protein
MICAIHQPQYLPWLGYFSKLDAADVFVIYDDTQYKHDEWQNRNRIKSPTAKDGWQWLTVPVHRSRDALIRDIQIDNTRRWAAKHINALSTNYGRAPFHKQYSAELTSVLENRWESLAELNVAVVNLLAGWLGIETRMLRSSELDYRGRSTDALVSMCRAAGADVYLSGPGGRGYLETDKFDAAGLALQCHDFDCPAYPQQFGDFVPGLSAVDAVFNCGPGATTVMRSGRRISECAGWTSGMPQEDSSHRAKGDERG